MDYNLEDVLNAYANGFFPMADNRDSDEFHWYDPPLRGQLDIHDLHIPARLRRRVLQFPYRVTIDMAFDRVIRECAAPASDRLETWINPGIEKLFNDLHCTGYTHSIEVWSREHNELVGGLYGLAIGGAFMGESMFSRATDASKIALVHLCSRLATGGFTVLDTQFVNDHLKQFGVYEISRTKYLERLHKALAINADFQLAEQDEQKLVEHYLSA